MKKVCFFHLFERTFVLRIFLLLLLLLYYLIYSETSGKEVVSKRLRRAKLVKEISIQDLIKIILL
jgi:hypothetical protein